LSDPLIRLMMEADRVDPQALEAMLVATASRIERHRTGVGYPGRSAQRDENLSRRNPNDEGENDRGLTTSDIKPRSLNQASPVRSSIS
jgi:hypothetical protein